jgi:Asp-tRNA(Asn)/Glu-tRNA(Gln) amidotransferase A subunit family amidase
MPDMELCYYDATTLAGMVRKRQVSPVELVKNALARIEQVNSDLNCFCYIYADEALELAKQAEAAVINDDQLGALHGVPIAIKDFTPIKGKRTTKGSHVFANDISTSNAIIVDKLTAAGSLIVGRTTTPEFTYSSMTHSLLWGVTRNPWNTQRTSGGSSGGSAAAVASGCVPLAEGTDSGGSVRIPASHCGIVGLKPSHGRIPFEFMPSQFDWMTTHGPLSRSVRDASLFLSLCQGPEPRDIQAILPKLNLSNSLSNLGTKRRLALSVDLGCYRVDDNVERNLRDCSSAFEAAGYEIEEVDLGWTTEFAQAWWTYWDVFMAANFGQYIDQYEDKMDPDIVSAIQNGLNVSGAELLQFGQVFTNAWHQLAPIFDRCDALLCPTESIPAPDVSFNEIEALTVQEDGRLAAMDMTMQFNALMLPAISVPSGFSKDGLPTGLQIVAPRGQDDTVLSLAAILERERPWKDHLPRI